MRYENHIPPEGINSKQEAPFKELAILIGGMALFLVIAVSCLYFFVSIIADSIPYEYEQKLSSYVTEKIIDDDLSPEEIAIQNYLQSLADELAENMELPSEMNITVHYSSNDTVNAFATLGGHVFMYKGLIEKLPNENALSMVMAHEIAHIKHRHPIVSMGQGLTLLIALAGISSVTDESITSGIASFVNVNSMRFSRGQETQADESGLNALAKKYNHTNGAEGLFEVFQTLEDENGSPKEFFSTHPLSKNRIDNITKWTQENNWPATGETTALPSIISSNLN